MRGQIASIGDHGQILVQIVEPEAVKFELDQFVDVKGWEAARTLDQNAFYHRFVGWALPWYKQHDPTMTHDILHAHFRDTIIGFDAFVLGRYLRVAPSTTTLSRKAFTAFFDEVMRRAAQEASVPVGKFEGEYLAWKLANGRAV